MVFCRESDCRLDKEASGVTSCTDETEKATLVRLVIPVSGKRSFRSLFVCASRFHRLLRPLNGLRSVMLLTRIAGG